MSFVGATTRLKRSIGQRDLWDVIVNNDDICFKYILPKLERIDVKFLHVVNTETRALIKRSSRKRELKKRFRVSELSSISTLEIAWENRSSWAGTLDCETEFCKEVAKTNRLELLEWIRGEKKCEWSAITINEASRQRNLEMVKYCVANKCPIDKWACAIAALYGQLEMLKYLHEEAEAPWDCHTGSRAAERGYLHILEYLVERKYDQFDDYVCRRAAEKGHLDCLKFLHETTKAPLDWYVIKLAHKNNHQECVQYLLDNDCPLPSGWHYEDGTLHTHWNHHHHLHYHAVVVVEESSSSLSSSLSSSSLSSLN